MNVAQQFDLNAWSAGQEGALDDFVPELSRTGQRLSLGLQARSSDENPDRLDPSGLMADQFTAVPSRIKIPPLNLLEKENRYARAGKGVTGQIG